MTLINYLYKFYLFYELATGAGVVGPNPIRDLCDAGRIILKEQTKSFVTIIIAPALSNSPQ